MTETAQTQDPVREGDSLGHMANRMYEKESHSQKSRKSVSFNRNCYFQLVFLVFFLTAPA